MTTSYSTFTLSKTLTMKLITLALLSFNLCISILTVQVAESQYVPKTCQCPQVQERVRGPFLDFRVTPKGPSCSQNEIIVTSKNKKPVCLSPEGRQGKTLIKCWHRMQKDGVNHKKCLRKQRPKQRKGKQAKSKKVMS